MSKKPKVKNIEPLPYHIKNAPACSALFFAFLLIIPYLLLSMFFDEGILNLIFLIFCIGGWFWGWAERFQYVRQHGDEGQQLQSQAHFWGKIALIIGWLGGLVILVAVSINIREYILYPLRLAYLISPLVITIISMFLAYLIGLAAQKAVYRILGYVEPKQLTMKPRADINVEQQ